MLPLASSTLQCDRVDDSDVRVLAGSQMFGEEREEQYKKKLPLLSYKNITFRILSTALGSVSGPCKNRQFRPSTS